MKSIEKKILPKYFRGVRKEEKNFELRKRRRQRTAGRRSDPDGMGKRRIYRPDRGTSDPVCASECAGIWADAGILHYRMVTKLLTIKKERK